MVVLLLYSNVQEIETNMELKVIRACAFNSINVQIGIYMYTVV